MEENSIKNIWNNYGTNLQADLEVNLSALNDVDLRSTRGQLNRLLYRRMAELVVFLAFLSLLSSFTIKYYEVFQFLISGVILGLFCLVGAIGSFWQVIQILRLDYTKSITLFQLQLEKLKTYSLQTMRLLLLSMPFYFTYIIIGFKIFLDLDIFALANSKWLFWNLILSITLIPLSLWVYRKLSYKTKSRWVKNMILENGGNQIHSAIKFINEIEEFKGNSHNN